MAIGIDDLYDDEDDVLEVQNPDLNLEIHDNPDLNNDDNLETSALEDFLKSRGIDDPSRIRFEDDNGNIEERDWNTLSKEELFNILNTPLSSSDDNIDYNNEGLTDEEIDLVNLIRLSNLTPSLYLQLIKGEQPEPQYKIDDLSDDEIYLLDLEDRVGELSDEDAAQALATAKQNEQLFLKQVEGIRKEYKEREEDLAKMEEALKEQEQQKIYEQFRGSVIDAISNFNNIGSFDLNFDNDDRNELAQFMLDRDEAGNNYLWLALLEPETLVKAAWFILNGEEAFENISDYFTSLIRLISENQYKKGLEDGKNNKSSKPTVIINKNNNNNHRKYNSVEDLDDDD